MGTALSNPSRSKVMPENNIGDGTMEHPYQLPYREYSREVEDFVKRGMHLDLG